MDPLTQSLLELIDSSSTPINSLDAAKILGQDHQRVIGAINSILAHPDILEAQLVSSKVLGVTKEGEAIITTGSHEAQVFNAVPADGIDQATLNKSFTDATVSKVGFSKAIAAGWIQLDKSAGKPVVRRKVDSIEDTVKDLLVRIASLKIDDVSDSQKSELKKRKLINESTIKSYDLSKGPKFTVKIEKPETDITSEMLVKGSWKEKTFKEYNFNALGIMPERGHLHPLLKVRQEFRQIFLEMGFSEMPTNKFIESCFWNFDALFQPQKHPARDAHDTFFISKPCKTDVKQIPSDYIERVKKVHSEGGYGSIGYQCEWEIEEAAKNILRTHTTAVSARMLYRAAQEYVKSKQHKPMKLFSIDRVFRNETLDSTHLAEFHQIEGVIMDIGLTLGDLMGVIKEFFRRLGMTEIKFKPAYNPYTEPSMEIFARHPGLNKWIEIGNSGVFRPEMLLPMGLPENVSVIAWGLSTERPTMIKYGINNIRDLVGHKVDLQMIQSNALCILPETESN